MHLYHNSQDINYRTPFGAVTLGSEVSLRISVSHFSGNTSAKIRIWTDIGGEEWVDMTAEIAGDSLLFSGSFKVPEEPCLLWYSFLVSDEKENLYYGNNKEKLGGVGLPYGHVPPSYQITVYRDFKIPDWYKNSVAYQIFPDRFHRGSDFVKRSADCLLDTERKGPKTILRQNWDDSPSYIKDEKGHVTHWDFFGGTLEGITEKLDYLESLGIGTLYLNPIFKALSNHRYDTSDYMEIDPRLGDDESFKTLCHEAKKRGIYIILDGVFNHTGNDSIYFDAYGNHQTCGAYQNPESPYADWYLFKNKEQTEYESWWGVKDLPSLNKENKEYQSYLYGGKNAVIRHWLKLGAKGWRLDVADELTDDFICGIRKAVKETDEDGLLLGEVWEDASNKVSYGTMRKYLLGNELDCVMNYPLRNAIIDFFTGKINAKDAGKTLMSLYENYPKPATQANFNLISSHDRARILTMLQGFDEQSKSQTNIDTDSAPLHRLWPVCVMQMTMPGVPCIYYGDEAGLFGELDPDNRKTYPWGKENKDTLSIYKNAISLRKEWPVFTSGDFCVIETLSPNVFAYKRWDDKEEIFVYLNRNENNCETVKIETTSSFYDLISATELKPENGRLTLSLSPCSAMVLRKEKRLDPWDAPRSAGVLCHITSIPSKFGQGDLGEGTRSFIRKLRDAGQTYWQILPLNPVDEYDSPYATSSAFAGNIHLISAEEMEKSGLLTKSELKEAEKNSNTFSDQKELKMTLLRKAFSRFLPDKDYDSFLEEQSFWLSDYCKFEVLKSHYNGKDWQFWPKKYQNSKADLPEKLQKEAEFYSFCQYIFYRQWKNLRKYAGENGIKIIGDLPFYVGLQGADVWSHKDLFQLNEEGFGTVSAGVPPDYFSKDGQIWNNPLYDWRNMKEDGYTWWLQRLSQAFSRYDLLRLDHFRGFEQYFSIPAGEKAILGSWKYGPGLELFKIAKETFGSLPILAEDLGDITIQVKNLLYSCGFLGTDVFQFSLYERLINGQYNAKEEAVLYSGTHDNQTLIGFLKDDDAFSENISSDDIISLLYESKAPIVILPLQDLLGLDDSARMNVPGKAENNWKWRFNPEDFSEEKILYFRSLSEKTNRV